MKNQQLQTSERNVTEMVKNVVFDIAGVIADWQPEKWLSRRFGPEAGPKLMAAVFGSDYWKEHIDMGYLGEEELFRHQAAAYPELAEALTALDKEWHTILQPLPDTEALMRRLKEAGYPVYFLSIFPERTVRYLWDHIPAFRLVDGGVVSWKVHQIKPNADIFRTLLDQYGLAAEETVFTDDTPINVEGARAAGLYAWHFTGAAGFEAYLKEELGLTF